MTMYHTRLPACNLESSTEANLCDVVWVNQRQAAPTLPLARSCVLHLIGLCGRHLTDMSGMAQSPSLTSHHLHPRTMKSNGNLLQLSKNNNKSSTVL